MKINKFDVAWTKSAANDLEEIIEYISNDSVESALNILTEIKEKTDKLCSFPERGRIVPELKLHNITNYREIIYSVWKLIYRIENDNVYVMTVIEGRRNIEDVLLNRLLRKN
ncbi:MAG: type II toxin-antitoxin system RelE/ParE family toxin [Spirochaetes bacterium]|nr:type II toxin-antitoxin system RelE/ParE family toxin [Spirochaetota bacterium]